MEKREVGRKSTRTVPVIIENHENAANKTKLMIPSNYTAGQLVNILRSRMHLRPYHPVYLFLKSKQSPVLMSKSIGHLHHKHRDEKGLLRLIHTGQASFGFRGNIRAIRFRQKWIENLHNNGGYSGGFSYPPPHFPLEPSSTTNFEVPLNVDDLNDENEEAIFADFYNDMSNPVIVETTDVSALPFSQSSNVVDSSQSSTNSSQSSALINLSDPWLSSGFADPWVTSTTNSVTSSNEIEQALYMELEMSMVDHQSHNTVESFPVHAMPNISTNVQLLNVSNPPIPENHLSLYESDSEFYDSDDMDN